MIITICKSFEFHAAHCLPDHEGKCKNLHGHTYLLQVEVSGPTKTAGSQSGMIMDFGELKKVVEEQVLTKVDHCNLNDVLPITTAEYMVYSIRGWIRDCLPVDVELERIRLYETGTSYAEWRRT